MMTQVLEQIGNHRLVPVVKIESAQDALPLGRALMAGGGCPWIAKTDLISAGRFADITQMTEEVVKLIQNQRRFKKGE